MGFFDKLFGRRAPQEEESVDDDELDEDEERADDEGEEGDDDEGEDEDEEEDEEIPYSPSDQKAIDETLKAKKRAVQFPPEVNQGVIDGLITDLAEAQKGVQLRGSHLNEQFVQQVAEIQQKIINELGPLPPGEAEIILQNISIDIDVRLTRGTLENLIYTSFNKLGEINVYNSELADTLKRLPGAKKVEEYLPTLSRIAGKGLNARAAITAGVIGVGGIVGGGLIATLLGTAAGAWAGYSFAKTLFRARGEQEFNETMQELNDIETRGLCIDNLSEKEQHELRGLRRKIMKAEGKGREPKDSHIERRDELELKATHEGANLEHLNDDGVRWYAKKLLQGAHRFEKAIGLKADGTIDRDTVPAKLLARLDKIKAKEVEDAVVSVDTEIAKMADEINEIIDHQRLGHVRSLFKGLRSEQKEERRHSMAGATAGAGLSWSIRFFVMPGLKGQTLDEAAEANLAFRIPTIPGLIGIEGAHEGSLIGSPGKHLEVALEGLKKAVSGIPGINYLETAGGAAKKMVEDSVTSARLKLGALNVPGGIHPEPISSAGASSTSLSASESALQATRDAAISAGATGNAEVGSVATGSTADATAGVKPAPPPAEPASKFVANTGAGKPAGVPGAEVPAEAVKLSAPSTPRTPELIPLAHKDMPPDWTMLKFLGQHLGEEVQKNLASARHGSFPASERGALLNVLYNLKEQGLIGMDGDKVALKVDEAELRNMYQSSHTEAHPTADAYGKKIAASHWKEWFGDKGESPSSVRVPAEHSTPKDVRVPAGKVYTAGSPEHEKAQPSLVHDAIIDEADRRVLSGHVKSELTPEEAGRESARLQKAYGSEYTKPAEKQIITPSRVVPAVDATPSGDVRPVVTASASIEHPPVIEVPLTKDMLWKHVLNMDNFYGGKLTGNVSFEYDEAGNITQIKSSLHTTAGPEFANQKIKYYGNLDRYLSEYGSAAKQATVLTGDSLRLAGQQLVIDESLHDSLVEQGRIKEAEYVAREMAQSVSSIAQKFGKEILRPEMLPDYVRGQVAFDKLPTMRDALKLPASTPTDFIQDIGKSIGKVFEGTSSVEVASQGASGGVVVVPPAEQVAPAVADTVGVDAGQKTGGAEVPGEQAKGPKVAAPAEKIVPKLSAEEFAKQAYQQMQDSLYKKHGIVPFVVDQIQGLRVSSFLERVAEVKAGKMDMLSAFSSDQFPLKEYEKLASYLTDHNPNVGEKRMLLKNYLLSKER